MIKTMLKGCWVIFILITLSSCHQKSEAEITQFPEVDQLIEEALRNDMFTGAVLLIGNSEKILHHKAFGYATLYDENLRVVAEPDSMKISHLFDIASLTKIFATTYGIMALHSDGYLDLDEPLSNILAEFDSNKHRNITIRHLLSHTSGLVQWYPTYYASQSSKQNREFIARLPLVNQPGENRRYSDLGFMLLADVIEQISGQSLMGYLNDRIYSKLEISDTQYGPILSDAADVVSTSHGNPFERKMVYEPDFGYNIDIDPTSWNDWRTHTLKGEVNDGNAHHTYRGTAGHAGLFSTAEELYKLLAVILKDGEYKSKRIFEPDTIEQFITADQFNNGMGWGMSPSTTHSSGMIKNAVGHTGFTGTNFLINKEKEIIYILLTNRQHVGIDEYGNYPNLRALREALSNLIF